MKEIEAVICKNIFNFCKILPGHVEKWRSKMEECVPLVRGVTNRAEQIRYVHGAHISYIEDLETKKEKLEYQIMTGIDEELSSIKDILEHLNKCNQDLKNKLSILDNSTKSLDWTEDSIVILGSGTVPPLSRLLWNGLEFSNFFQNAYKTISVAMKNLNWCDEKVMNEFQKAFVIDFDNRLVSHFLAVTQYVCNDKTII